MKNFGLIGKTVVVWVSPPPPDQETLILGSPSGYCSWDEVVFYRETVLMLPASLGTSCLGICVFLGKAGSWLRGGFPRVQLALGAAPLPVWVW